MTTLNRRPHPEVTYQPVPNESRASIVKKAEALSQRIHEKFLEWGSHAWELPTMRLELAVIQDWLAQSELSTEPAFEATEA